jgi:hypothetical protein
MRQKSGSVREPAEQVVKNIRGRRGGIFQPKSAYGRCDKRYQGELGHDLLQGAGLPTQVLDLVRGGRPHRIAGQPFLAGFQKVLRPAVIEVLDNAFAAAELGEKWRRRRKSLSGPLSPPL